MVARVSTMAFEGVEARPVDVQVQIASGTVAFTIVGLGDKAVAELRESECVRRSSPPASRFQPSALRSILRRPTCQRMAENYALLGSTFYGNELSREIGPGLALNTQILHSFYTH